MFNEATAATAASDNTIASDGWLIGYRVPVMVSSCTATARDTAKQEVGMNKQVEEAIGIVDRIATEASAVGLLTKLRVVKSPCYNQSIRTAVISDLKRLAEACRWIDSLDRLLVEDGKSTPLARSLAAAPNDRPVGKYRRFPAKSATAKLTDDLLQWVNRIGMEIFWRTERPLSAEQLPPVDPHLWESLATELKSGDADDTMVIQTAEVFNRARMLPDCIADDAAAELYAMQQKLGTFDSDTVIITDSEADQLEHTIGAFVYELRKPPKPRKWDHVIAAVEDAGHGTWSQRKLDRMLTDYCTNTELDKPTGQPGRPKRSN